MMKAILTLVTLLQIGAAWADSPVLIPAIVPELKPGYLIGYLPPRALPNSLSLLLPPPAADSAAAAADMEAYRSTRTLRDTPRWAQASRDAQLSFPAAAEIFSCAAMAPISDKTPHLYMLLRRSLTDAGLATYAAKNHYQRTRPFVVARESTCTPSDDAELSRDGSYPSGHASVGWAWALILAEVAPDRADAILARGLAFGQSRVVCGAHWQSDVDAGRLVAAGTVARMHADPVFRAELEAAKAELAAVRAVGQQPARDCGAESAALSQSPEEKTAR
jgi:acid phosphatase (class A)